MEKKPAGTLPAHVLLKGTCGHIVQHAEKGNKIALAGTVCSQQHCDIPKRDGLANLSVNGLVALYMDFLQLHISILFSFESRDSFQGFAEFGIVDFDAVIPNS
jgi:hypothetical protein